VIVRVSAPALIEKDFGLGKTSVTLVDDDLGDGLVGVILPMCFDCVLVVVTLMSPGLDFGFGV